MLPAFLRSEGNRSLPADALHGRDGPLAVSTPPPDGALCDALLAAGRQLGLAATADFNGPQQDGVGYYQHTLADGRRCSSARAYLAPARGRANLTVWTDAAAQRLLFDAPVAGQPPRATGVALLRGGQALQVRATREVIVAAGAIHSPQLLQCSGIGPGALLQRLGLPVQVDAPEVGRNLQDHLQARLRYTLNRPWSLNSLYHSPLRTAGEVLKYALARRGRLAQAPIRAGAFCRSAEGEARPDLQFHFIEFTSEGMGQPPHRTPGFQSSVCVLRPQSRGEVMATAPDMSTPPAVCGHFLSHPDDAERTLRGVRLARRLAAQPALAGLIREEAEPGPARTHDDALLDWVRGNAVTVYHPVGTCRMGGDARRGARPAAAGARRAGAAGGGCVGDAHAGVGQHQRTHDHDRREGGRTAAAGARYERALHHGRPAALGLPVRRRSHRDPGPADAAPGRPGRPRRELHACLRAGGRCAARLACPPTRGVTSPAMARPGISCRCSCACAPWATICAPVACAARCSASQKFSPFIVASAVT